MSGTLNKVTLIGNLGDDVKMHQFDESNSIGRFPIATTESFTSKESGEKVSQTEWHNIVVRNKLAEICSKFIRKGDKVFVEGRLKTRKWQGNDNQDRYTTEIIANEVIFLNTKGNSSNDGTSNYSQSSSSSSSSTQDFNQDNSRQNESEPDDLPF